MGDLQEFTHCRCCYCTLPYLISGCLLNNTHDVIPLFYDVVMAEWRTGKTRTEFRRLWRCYEVLNCCLMADITTFIPRNDGLGRIAPLWAWRRNFSGQSQGVRSRWCGRHDWLMASGRWTGRPWNYDAETPRHALICTFLRSVMMAPLHTGCISAVSFGKSPKLLPIFNDAICSNMANMAIIIAHNWLLNTRTVVVQTCCWFF